jgi:hypothetical protein
MINNSAVYNHPDIIKKKAISMDYTDLGEIKEVDLVYIKTKGIIRKNIFYNPKDLCRSF